MIEVREQTNPFTKAKVVSVNTNPAVYHPANGEIRGSKDFVMSRSELMEFNHCPRRWINGFVSKDGSASEWGSVMDGLLLDFHNFFTRFAVAPATYESEGKRKGDPPVEKPWTYQSNVCKEWRAAREAEGKQVLKAEDYAEAQIAEDVLEADETVWGLIQDSQKQVFVLAEYHDRDTDLTIPVKALIDLVPPVDGPFGKTLIDFKTAASAAPGPWQRAVYEHGYYVQAALYLDAYCAATGEDRVDFFHIISENYPPFEIGKRMLSAEFVNLGRVRYTDALGRYCRCLKTGVWPGYDTDPMGLSFHGFNIVEPAVYMLT